MDQAELSAVGLDQACDEKRVIHRVEDVEVELGPVVPPIQMALLQERESDQESGRVDNDVHLRAASVREVHRPAVEPCDVRFRRDVTVANVVREQEFTIGWVSNSL